jgi:branched-chain amino acid transport system ATP-binding protein
MLSIRNLTVRYGAIPALRDVSLDVNEGEIVTLIGANGAGKTTLLRAVSGLLRSAAGSILYQGKEITPMPSHRIVAAGLSHVPEGRMVFGNLTVLENLRMGGYLQRNPAEIRAELRHVYKLFPRLEERGSQLAGTLSGGEQQMLAIGRALMAKPRFLMLDEPSLGIAPILVRAIFEKIVEINRDGKITILLVEQNANLALEISRRAYVLETGEIILSGDSSDLRDNPRVRSAYLGG